MLFSTKNNELPALDKLVFCDIEGDSLSKASKIWCAVVHDPELGQLTFTRHGAYGFKTIEDFLFYSKDAVNRGLIFVGHNFLGYDAHVINDKVNDELLTPKNTLDTTVLSRFIAPDARTAPRGFAPLYIRDGGHSLEAWGKRLGVFKGDYSDWSKLSQEMVTYCQQDVVVLRAIWNRLVEEWNHRIDADDVGNNLHAFLMENECHYWLTIQKQNGFTLNRKQCEELYNETDRLLVDYMGELQKVFPPIRVVDRVIKDRRNKDGSMNSALKKTLDKSTYEKSLDEAGNSCYKIYKYEEFNPDSPNQVAKRLLDKGWNPKKFTPTGAPATDKESIKDALEQLSGIPEVQVLAKFNIVKDRWEKAKRWFEYAKEDGKMHGDIFHIGTWTYRCSHSNDNMANIPRVATEKGEDGKEHPILNLRGGFGFECRNCWTVEEGYKQVGCDASGIQLRALAHYVNDPELTYQICDGDIHTFNAIKAGILRPDGTPNRPVAKTFIYAWLLGAGDEKVGYIVGIIPEELEQLLKRAKKYDLEYTVKRIKENGGKATKLAVARILKGRGIKRKFLESIPALKEFKEGHIKEIAAKGYTYGLDGRRMFVPSEHKALALYLQSFEAIVMKTVVVIVNRRCKQKGIYYKQLGFIHDELQIQTKPYLTKIVGEMVVKAIEVAGKMYNSNCPLTGEWREGYSWGSTH